MQQEIRGRELTEKGANDTVLPAFNHCWAKERFESLHNYRTEKLYEFNSGIIAKKSADTTRPLILMTTSEGCFPLMFVYSKAFFFSSEQD